MQRVELNAFELGICMGLAEERQMMNEYNYVVDRRIAIDKSSVEVHLQGVKGELALAKYLNVYPDFTTNCRKGGSELVYRGWRLDAKNRNPYRDLMTPASKRPGEADIYVCITGDNPLILLGWCFDKEFIIPERIVTWTPIKSYFMEEKELRDMNDLLNISFCN